MTPDADQYCRDLESYLCRRNAGHLVRIVGPSFEAVQRWFQLGVPFKVACLGIDRHCDRLDAKPAGRRRPVRIEFCDADVLDAFDEWRRAVGIRPSEVGAEGEDPDATSGHTRARVSLAAHLERTLARLTAVRSGPQESDAWSAALETAARRLDALLAPARKARGETKDALLAELIRVDADLLAAALRTVSPALLAQATDETETELAPFRTRLPASEYEAALQRGRARALRARLGLPVIVLE